MSRIHRISIALSTLLAAPVTAELQWTIQRNDLGDIELRIADGLTTSTEVLIDRNEYAVDQPMTATLSIDQSTSHQRLHLDWRSTQGGAEYTSAALPTLDTAPPAHHVRMRWARVGVAPMPTDHDGDHQVGRFLIQHHGPAGVLLHGVETNSIQPRPWGHVDGDVDGDEFVNVYDILQVVSHWTPLCGFDDSCQGDADFDGDVDADDLLMILQNYHSSTSSEPAPGGSDETVSTGEPGEHVAWSWTPTTEDSLDSVVPFIWAPSWRTPEQVAAEAATRPEGHRVVFFFSNIANDLTVHPEDACVSDEGDLTAMRSPWIEHGLKTVHSRFEDWFEAFVAAGGTLDAVILDNELTLSAGQFMGSNGANWDAIMEDPRFPALAESLGFSDLQSINWGNDRFNDWNRLMTPRFDAAVDASVFSVVRSHFPDASCTNYQSFSQNEDVASLDIAGHPLFRYSDGCGTHCSRSFYGRISPALAATSLDGDEPVGNEAWSSLMLCLHRLRGMRHSSSSPMMAWVSNRSWPGTSFGATPLQNNALWDELVLHLGLHGVDQFLYWTQMNPMHGSAESDSNPPEDQHRINDLMLELDGRIGGLSPDESLFQPSFGEHVTASSMRDGQHVVWRFSFHPGVAGVALRFDDGEEIYLQPEAGRRGAWLEHGAHRRLEMNTLGSAPALTAVIPSEF